MSEFVSLNWFAWVHLQSLITFRDSEQTMDAGNDWLDKEISDLKTDLGIQEGRHMNQQLQLRIQLLKQMQSEHPDTASWFDDSLSFLSMEGGEWDAEQTSGTTQTA